MAGRSPTNRLEALARVSDKDAEQMKTESEIMDAVKAAIERHSGARQPADMRLTADTPLTEEATGLDSLDLLELWLELEEAFGFPIPENDARGATTVGGLVAVIVGAQPASTNADIYGRPT